MVPVLGNLLGPEADPIVFDRDQQRVGQPLQEHAHRRRLGVLGDVRQRLLDDAVDRGLGLRRQPFDPASCRSSIFKPWRRPKPLKYHSIAAREPQIVQHRGMEEP